MTGIRAILESRLFIEAKTSPQLDKLFSIVAIERYSLCLFQTCLYPLILSLVQAEVAAWRRNVFSLRITLPLGQPPSQASTRHAVSFQATREPRCCPFAAAAARAPAVAPQHVARRRTAAGVGSRCCSVGREGKQTTGEGVVARGGRGQEAAGSRRRAWSPGRAQDVVVTRSKTKAHLSPAC
jgi:hypothetical protein